MKKIFSLVLAVLMLAGLGLSSFAADTFRPITPGDIIGILGPTQVPTGLITDWYTHCPKEGCNGIAYCYVSGGGVVWICGTCGASDVYYTDAYLEHASHTPLSKCQYCGQSASLVSAQPVKIGDKLYDAYQCLKCGKYSLTEVKTAPETHDISHKVSCPSCKKDATFDKLTVMDGKIYALYICTGSERHPILIPVDNSYLPTVRDYTVYVMSPYGYGTWYDYEISDGENAKYGDEKTVTFYPPQGFALVDVTVNGTSVDFANNKATFKVYGNTIVRPSYAKLSALVDYKITATCGAGGAISATKNGHSADAAKISAKYVDEVTYFFRPASRNYKIDTVKIDGKSVGAPSSYTFKKLGADHTVDVTFKWKSPYADVDAKYLPAVEYVTEAGIMGAAVKQGVKSYFSGSLGITVGDFVCAVVELTDTENALKTDEARIQWAIANNLITENDDLTAACCVQIASSIVSDYLKAVEKINGITFTKFNANASAKDNAITIKLVTEKTYEGNRALNRYDLAAVCRLISRLSYN